MPTLNDVIAGSLQQSVQVQQVIDLLKGTPNKGVPVALTALNDPTNYSLTVQNTDPLNSRALSVLKSDGTPLITADVNGVQLGSPLILPTGSITSAAILDGTIATADIANQAVTNVKLGTDTARLNLLADGGFEIWQRGTNFGVPGTGAFLADRWQIQISGSGVAGSAWVQDSANADAGSLYCLGCPVTTSTIPSPGVGGGNSVRVEQKIEDFRQLRGRTVTFSVRVKSLAVSQVQPYINDGVAQYSVAAVATTTSYQTFSITATLSGSATALYVGVYFAGGTSFYLDNAMLVVGSVAADYAPLTPADDLARCLRYYDQFNQNNTTQICSAFCTSATSGQGHLRG